MKQKIGIKKDNIELSSFNKVISVPKAHERTAPLDPHVDNLNLSKTTEKSDRSKRHKPNPIHDNFLECTESISAIEVTDKEDIEAIETLEYLIGIEKNYAADPYYLEGSEFTWGMRLILLDWLMEVSTEFQFKRECFYYSVNYIDRYLSKVRNVSKDNLQLVGITALRLAAKIEEAYIPKVKDFVLITDNAYTIEQIKMMESSIAYTLSWHLTPPTLNTWRNWYMEQWDAYVQYNNYAKNNILIKSLPDDLILFKVSNEKAYAHFRELCQLIDLAVLDIRTLKHSPRTIIASGMYILLAFHFGHITIEAKGLTSLLLDASLPLNNLFEHFVNTCFGFELEELLVTIEYMGKFMLLEFDYSIPVKLKPKGQVFV